MKPIEVGRLLRGAATGFVVGCRVTQIDAPSLGALVLVPQAGAAGAYEIFGIIHDIRVDDDGLVRQLVTAENVADNIIQDNRVNRNVPLEISVLAVGYRQAGRIFHLLPPRPPLSLDLIYKCSAAEICEFTSAGHFGYFRHILRAADLPVGEILAAHLQQGHEAHATAGQPDWAQLAARELITLLRDDYATLMAVLGALADTGILN